MDKLSALEEVAKDSQAVCQHLYNDVLKHPLMADAAKRAAALAVPAARALVRMSAKVEPPSLVREDPETDLFSAVSLYRTARMDTAKAFNATGEILKSGNIPVQRLSGFSVLGSHEEDWLRQVYDRSKNSVAEVMSADGPPGATAFVVDSRGILATNRHVARSIGRHGFAVFPDRRRYATKLIIEDTEQDADVALLRLKAKPGEQFPALPLGDAASMPSFKAAVLGHPITHRSRLPVLSPGILNYLGYGHAAQVGLHMKAFFGNSGSPILDEEGKVIGLVESGDVAENRTWGPAVQHVKQLLAEAKDLPEDSAPLSVRTIVQELAKDGLPTLKIVEQEDLSALRRDRIALRKLQEEYQARTLHRWLDV